MQVSQLTTATAQLIPSAPPHLGSTAPPQYENTPTQHVQINLNRIVQLNIVGKLGARLKPSAPPLEGVPCLTERDQRALSFSADPLRPPSPAADEELVGVRVDGPTRAGAEGMVRSARWL